MEKDVKELVGRTVLYRRKEGDSIMEGKIEKISPSEKYVKINLSWFEIDKIEILDVLPEEA